MFDLDLKSLVVGFVISAAAGGGLYGYYVKTGGEAGMAQAEAYRLLGRCTFLKSSLDADEIKTFISTTNESLSDIEKSDAIVTGIAAAANSGHARTSGFGVSLKMCLNELKDHLNRIDRG